MDATAKARSARWRDRRRLGAFSVSIDVLPAPRRALQTMGLIAAGNERNRDAIAWAVARFLDTAPAVASIGIALYPNVDEFFKAEDSNVLPFDSGKNEG